MHYRIALICLALSTPHAHGYYSFEKATRTINLDSLRTIVPLPDNRPAARSHIAAMLAKGIARNNFSPENEILSQRLHDENWHQWCKIYADAYKQEIQINKKKITMLGIATTMCAGLTFYQCWIIYKMPTCQNTRNMTCWAAFTSYLTRQLYKAQYKNLEHYQRLFETIAQDKNADTAITNAIKQRIANSITTTKILYPNQGL